MNDITIHTMKYITIYEASEVADCKCNEFFFAEECEENGHIVIGLADWRVEELEEDVKYYQDRKSTFEYQYCKNELKLVNYLRSKGYREAMYILF